MIRRCGAFFVLLTDALKRLCCPHRRFPVEMESMSNDPMMNLYRVVDLYVVGAAFSTPYFGINVARQKTMTMCIP